MTPAHSNATPRPRNRGCLAGLVLLALIGLAFWLYHRHQAAAAAAAAAVQARPAAVPVTVAIAKLGSVGIYLNAIGTVTPVYTDAITAQVGGVLTAVHYREGQMVKVGDPLVDIDPRTYEAQLQEAEGTLARDQSLLAEAQMDLQRYQQAWSENAIPRQQLEDQAKQVAIDEGTVKNDQGLVRLDQLQVQYCHITAPIAGRTGLRLVDPGNLISANGSTTLVVIAQVQPTTVIFTISEDNLGSVASQMARGQSLQVDAWDRQQSTKLATGKLLTLDNQIDTTTGTVKARAEFANTDRRLFPNEFVNTVLRVRTINNQILVPASAVQHNGDAAFVYVIQNQKAVLRNVKAGYTDNGQTAVTGVNAGEVVANSSFDKLQNGARITVSTQQLPTSSSDDSSPLP